MTSLVTSGVLAVLLDTLVKGSLILVAAAICARLLRRHSAAARHAVWTVALLAQLALPFLSATLPAWTLPLLPRTEPSLVAIAPPTVPGQSAPKVTVVELVPSHAALARDQRGTAPRSGMPTLWMVLGALWLGGVVVILARLLLGATTVAGLARRAHRVDDRPWLTLLQRIVAAIRIRRPVRLLRGDRLAVPVTCGVWSPAVLLPPDSDEWSAERRSFVLTHELAHVKRFDVLTQLIGQAAAAVFWMNPLVWLAVRRMRLERERACDDYVLRTGLAPSTYAQELLAMVHTLNASAAEPAFAALALARHSEFEGRLLAILDPHLRRQALGRRGAVLTGLGALLVVPLAVLRPVAREVSGTAYDASRDASHRVAAIAPPLVPPAAPIAPPTAPSVVRSDSAAHPSAQHELETLRQFFSLLSIGTQPSAGDGGPAPGRVPPTVARASTPAPVPSTAARSTAAPLAPVPVVSAPLSDSAAIRFMLLLDKATLAALGIDGHSATCRSKLPALTIPMTRDSMGYPAIAISVGNQKIFLTQPKILIPQPNSTVGTVSSTTEPRDRAEQYYNFYIDHSFLLAITLRADGSMALCFPSDDAPQRRSEAGRDAAVITFQGSWRDIDTLLSNLTQADTLHSLEDGAGRPLPRQARRPARNGRNVTIEVTRLDQAVRDTAHAQQKIELMFHLPSEGK